MSCSCRKNTAWLSRSENSATSTLAPVTSSRPEDWTWIAARCSTRWNPAVGLASPALLPTRLASWLSTYSVRSRRSRSMSTLQARMTAMASWSSASASSRCSSVAYSWRRSLAWASARCSDCSRLGDNIGRLLLLQRALQRMLVPPREIDHLRYLGLRHLVGVDAANPNAAAVDMQHDLGRILAILVEETFEHMHDELHRRVVVIEQEDLVHRGLLGLGLGFDHDPRRRVLLVHAIVVAHRRLDRPARTL